MILSYVYDEYGNVRFVLPPLASDNLNGIATWSETDDAYVCHEPESL